jgi:GDP-L-fucose synthase
MRGKKIVVTGGYGFLGKHVVRELLNKGYKKIGVPSHEEYDLTSRDGVFSMFADYDPKIVIHLAANCGGIEYNKENPAKLFYDNAIMGIQMIHTAMQFLVEKFVQIGTVCSYPKFPYTVPFEEGSLWFGYPEETNAPYGLAKKMLLTQIQAYNKQYEHFNGIYIIPSNLYGPGDNFNPESSHVIPALIKKFVEAKERGDEKVTIWGSGSATREFLYVEDAAKAIVLATEQYNKNYPINIGTGLEISIAKLALIIKELVGFEGLVVSDDSKPNGQPRRVLNTSRASKEFGFKASTSLKEGLEKTIEYYIKNKGDLDNG